MSIENRRLRREAVNRPALQHDPERYRQEDDGFGRAQGLRLSRAAKATESILMLLVRIFQRIPRVAHVYWEN